MTNLSTELRYQRNSKGYPYIFNHAQPNGTVCDTVRTPDDWKWQWKDEFYVENPLHDLYLKTGLRYQCNYEGKPHIFDYDWPNGTAMTMSSALPDLWALVPTSSDDVQPSKVVMSATQLEQLGTWCAYELELQIKRLRPCFRGCPTWRHWCRLCPTSFRRRSTVECGDVDHETGTTWNLVCTGARVANKTATTMFSGLPDLAALMLTLSDVVSTSFYRRVWWCRPRNWNDLELGVHMS